MTTTRGERLKLARSRHFKSARAAAAALRVPPATYGAHERAEAPGGRDYGPDEAKSYARRFGTTAEWLLTGVGDGPTTGALPKASSEKLSTSGIQRLMRRLDIAENRARADATEFGELVSEIRTLQPAGLLSLPKGETDRLLDELDRILNMLEAARQLHKAIIEEFRGILDRPEIASARTAELAETVAAAMHKMTTKRS